MRSLALLTLIIAIFAALTGCASLSSDCVEVAYCPTVTFGVSVEIPLYGSDWLSRRDGSTEVRRQ